MLEDRSNCSTFKSTTYSSETCLLVACVITNDRSGLKAETMGEFILDLNWKTECHLIGSKTVYTVFSCTRGPNRFKHANCNQGEKAFSLLIWCGMLWRSCTRQDSLYVSRVKLGEQRGGGRRLGMGARAQNQQHTRITFYSESWCVTLSCEDIYAVVK